MEQSKKKKIIKWIVITLLCSLVLILILAPVILYFIYYCGIMLAVGIVNYCNEHGGISDPDPKYYHWIEYSETYKDSMMTQEYFYEHYDEIREKVERDGIITFSSND